MTGSKLHRVIVAAASLAAGCTAGVDAQSVPAKAAPADEPVKPAAARPAADDGTRALAEEVARLRAQLADLRSAQAAAQAPSPQRAVEPQPAADGGPAARDPQPAGRIAMGQDDDAPPATTVVERETVVERDVPVYVDREVPVYVDREVLVEPAPTVVIERVVCGDECCEQWVPVGHVHSPGCGHHYYGCACHPSYASLNPGVSLSFTYVSGGGDDDDDHDGGHHGGHSGGESHGHAPPPRASSGGQGRTVSSVPVHRAESDVPRLPSTDRTDVAPQMTPPRVPDRTPADVVAAGGGRPPAALPRRHPGDAETQRGGRDATAPVETPPAADPLPPRRDASDGARPGKPDRERADPPRRPEAPQRPAERKHEPEIRRDRTPDPPPAPAVAPPPPPPPPPPREPQKRHKG